MKYINLFFLSLMILCYRDLDATNASNSIKTTSVEELRDLHDFENFYCHEFNKLFDLSILSIDSRNTVFIIKSVCFSDFFKVIKTIQDYDDLMLNMRSRIVEYLADVIPLNIARRVIQDNYSSTNLKLEKRVLIEKNIIEEEANEIIKSAADTHKGCLNFMVNGELVERITQKLAVILDEK